MDCKLADCDKSWNEPDGEFPICLRPFCPLRAEQIKLRPASSEKPVFQTSPSQALNIGKNKVGPQVAQSLESLRDECETKFVPYNMAGSLSACTTVTLKDGSQPRSFTTTNQMHSEMMAIQKMIEDGHWTVHLGMVVWADDCSLITLAQFKTTEPHCGFCTVFLLAAGLPVGKPTCGNHKLASRFAYMLPIALETSPHFLARVLDSGCYCGFPAIKSVLNVFVNRPADQWVLSIGGAAFVNEVSYIIPNGEVAVIEWFDLVDERKRDVIYQIWKVIFERIMLTNKEY